MWNHYESRRDERIALYPDLVYRVSRNKVRDIEIVLHVITDKITPSEHDRMFAANTDSVLIHIAIKSMITQAASF